MKSGNVIIVFTIIGIMIGVKNGNMKKYWDVQRFDKETESRVSGEKKTHKVKELYIKRKGLSKHYMFNVGLCRIKTQ